MGDIHMVRETEGVSACSDQGDGELKEQEEKKKQKKVNFPHVFLPYPVTPTPRKVLLQGHHPQYMISGWVRLA